MICNFLESLKMHIDSIEKARCAHKIPPNLADLWPNFLEDLLFARHFEMCAALPPIETPISGPIFADLGHPSNTKPISHLSKTGKKGAKNKKLHHILGTIKFKVHLQKISKVLTRAGCGGKRYLEIKR